MRITKPHSICSSPSWVAIWALCSSACGFSSGYCLAWSSHPLEHHQPRKFSSSTKLSRLVGKHGLPCLFAEPEQKGSMTVEAPMSREEEEETPAGVVGSQFFGGNKQKEEFYDPVAEAEAVVLLETQERTLYHRFEDPDAFPDELAASVARDLQLQINALLWKDGRASQQYKPMYTYASSVSWNTPLYQPSIKDNANQPLQAIKAALEFYRNLDVAITSGRVLDDGRLELTWEISLVWPTLWEPRVLLTGTSQLELDDRWIVKQTDRLDAGDLTSAIGRQLIPRFWDIYHIGMTPSAELSPKHPTPVSSRKKILASYQVYDLPSRLYLQPSLLDCGERDDANAGIVPNHAFTCVVKTMGPQRDRYVPTSPAEIRLQVPLEGAEGPLRIQWMIPLAVLCQSNLDLILPGPDEEANAESQPICQYVWQARRRVATVPFAGEPQASNIPDVRKRLYEAVTKDGWKPKVDRSGRPVFFFWQNGVKACYTENGLGMVVYEWRPDVVQSNSVGIELEL